MEQKDKPTEIKKGRGGRKPKADHELAKHDVHFRVTDAELNLLEKQFKNSPYKNKSDMYHDMVFSKQLKIKDSTGLVLATEMQNLVREIKVIGTNYNQVVKKINSLTEVKPAIHEVVKLIDLTAKLEKAQSEFYVIILQLREKWLQG